MSTPTPPQGTHVAVPVKNFWSQVTTYIQFVGGILIPALLGFLNDIAQMTFIPQKVLVGILIAISILTAVSTLYRKLYGQAAITPTLAAKTISQQ